MRAERSGLVFPRLRLSKLMRYGAASVVTTVASLVILGLLLLSLTAVQANLVAVGVGSVISFEFNRRWVWRQAGRRDRWRQLLVFVSASLLFLAVSSLAIRAVGRALDHGVDPLWRALLIETTTVAVFGLRWAMQYLFLDRVLFRDPEAATRMYGPETTP